MSCTRNVFVAIVSYRSLAAGGVSLPGSPAVCPCTKLMALVGRSAPHVPTGHGPQSRDDLDLAVDHHEGPVMLHLCHGTDRLCCWRCSNIASEQMWRSPRRGSCRTRECVALGWRCRKLKPVPRPPSGHLSSLLLATLGILHALSNHSYYNELNAYTAVCGLPYPVSTNSCCGYASTMDVVLTLSTPPRHLSFAVPHTFSETHASVSLRLEKLSLTLSELARECFCRGNP